MPIKIETSSTNAIPSRPKYPFAELEVGNTFFVPRAKANSIRSLSTYWGYKLTRKFTVRTEKGGVRVWRIE